MDNPGLTQCVFCAPCRTNTVNQFSPFTYVEISRYLNVYEFKNIIGIVQFTYG